MDGFILAYTIVVGLVLLVGLITLIYSLNRVLPYRKPLYWIAIPMNAALIVTFGASLLRRLDVSLPQNTILFSLLFSFFMIGLLLILVPYVDRLEARRLEPIELAAASHKEAEDVFEQRTNGH